MRILVPAGKLAYHLALLKSEDIVRFTYGKEGKGDIPILHHRAGQDHGERAEVRNPQPVENRSVSWRITRSRAQDCAAKSYVNNSIDAALEPLDKRENPLKVGALDADVDRLGIGLLGLTRSTS